MPNSNYDYGFPNGVVIRNNPIVDILNGDGQVFWVDSNKGTDNGKGNFKYPFKTINYAVTRCVENRGEKIFVSAGHIETVSSAGKLTIGKSGITIYFMGNGSNRGKIIFSLSTLASILVTAPNVTLINPTYVNFIDGLAAPINIQAPCFTMINSEYYDGDGINSVKGVVCSSAAHYVRINGYKYFRSDEAGEQKLSHIELPSLLNMSLENINITGDFSVGNINNVSAGFYDAVLNGIVLRNYNQTPKPGMLLQDDSSGQAKNVDIRIESGANYVSDVAAINWDNNCLGYNADGYSGTLIGTVSP